MNLKERIARRQRSDDGSRPIVDYRAISPAAHPEEPENRGQVLERLLDALNPVFRGGLPANTYVHGPPGSGKTAVVRGLFDHLARHVAVVDGRIATSTRGDSSGAPEFVYVDARRATSEFRLYRAVLRSLVDEDVPGGGVRTDELGERLRRVLAPPGRAVVVAVDHLGEPRTMDLAALRSAFEPVADDVTWLGVGAGSPDDLEAPPPDQTLSVPAYEQHALEDVLSARASRGLASTALAHERVRRIATWAGGDAHDGLAALFGAATLAMEAGADAVREGDVEAAIEAVPREGVPIGLVLALPENRRTILRALIDLEERDTVGATATAIADRPGVDLSEGTVERFLYELADWGVLERVATEAAETDVGRPPSRVEPRFPTLVFSRLYDLADGEDR